MVAWVTGGHNLIAREGRQEEVDAELGVTPLIDFGGFPGFLIWVNNSWYEQTENAYHVQVVVPGVEADGVRTSGRSAPNHLLVPSSVPKTSFSATESFMCSLFDSLRCGRHRRCPILCWFEYNCSGQPGDSPGHADQGVAPIH